MDENLNLETTNNNNEDSVLLNKIEILPKTGRVSIHTLSNFILYMSRLIIIYSI